MGDSQYLHIRTEISYFNKASSYHVVRDTGVQGVLDDADIIQDDLGQYKALSWSSATKARDEWVAMVSGKFAERARLLSSEITAVQKKLEEFKQTYSDKGYNTNIAYCSSYNEAVDALNKLTSSVESAYRIKGGIREKFGQNYVVQFEREYEQQFAVLLGLDAERLALAREWESIGAYDVYSFFDGSTVNYQHASRAQICGASVVVQLQL